ncbi:hypothetical protein [Pseudomonas lundensis]|uniref:hypothetical protein n=1 Tax=Pseudomonas lundensis TaxID=86185 RepID=UPI0018671F21|nr:hypothetical protein [Pseudomonas lundensis]
MKAYSSPIKGSLLFSVLVLLIILGFPRIYGTELPMALLLIPFYIVGFVRFQTICPLYFAVSITLFLLWLLGGVVVFLIGEGRWQDLFFHLIVSFKMLLNVFFGYVIYIVVSKYSSALLVWLSIQTTIIIASIFSFDFYSFLLGFISPRSAEVFQYVFGLRAIGFGLFHVDGALTLVIASFYYLLVSDNKFTNKLLLLLMLPISMAVARSAIIPYAILGGFKKGLYLKLSLIFSLVVMLVLSVTITSGPVYEATEIFRNFLDRGDFHSDSVNSLTTMYVFPENLETYVYGAGKYFESDTSDLAFYMYTDVGYLRLLFYSGMGSVFLFILINIYGPASVLCSKSYPGSADVKMFSLALIFIFLIVNFKGLQVMSIFAVVMFYHSVNKKQEWYLLKSDVASS